MQVRASSAPEQQLLMDFEPVSQVGWKHQASVAELEARRLEKAKGFYTAKKKLIALKAQAAAEATA